jgi:KaiC/GvpD/RAD55 family RecA-like ATPase
MTERISTGIAGLDKAIGGGILKNSVFLICGTSGSGKSTATRQVVAEALKRGESCMLITTDEPTEAVLSAAEQMGFGFKKAVDKGLLTIIEFRKVKQIVGNMRKPVDDTDKLKIVMDELRKTAKKGTKIVAIDSISSFTELDGITRAEIENIFGEIKDLGMTCIMSGEAREGQEGLTVDGISEFKSDGVIVMHYLVVGVSQHRNLYIQKMRQSKHSEELHPIEITSKGIKVKSPGGSLKL